MACDNCHGEAFQEQHTSFEQANFSAANSSCLDVFPWTSRADLQGSMLSIWKLSRLWNYLVGQISPFISSCCKKQGPAWKTCYSRAMCQTKHGSNEIFCDLQGQVAVVTDAHFPGSLKIVCELCNSGAYVVLLVNNLSIGRETALRILQENPSATLSLMCCNLKDLESVRNFATQFHVLNLPLHVLVNAGFPNDGSRQSRDFEKTSVSSTSFSADSEKAQFRSEFYGQFLLSHLLLGKLQQTAFEEGTQTRVVNVLPGNCLYFQVSASEGSTKVSPTKIDLSVLNFTAELSRRLGRSVHGGQASPLVTVNACTLGCVHKLIGSTIDSFDNSEFSPQNSPANIPVCDVYGTLPFQLATDPFLRDISGQYFCCSVQSCEQRKRLPPSKLSAAMYNHSLQVVGLPASPCS
eukprot:CAMPEP_0177610710 /NCGR_PEP_ID=MMETSP0419_2-20121207/19950_1 /TAXON_ID=582737 /ORGANISM="Tetraselmis sp., Strain GSL018" /LENGTH=406 /DNA_ID=CAMNT_0019106085 /DNA_START=529 /DNA_END=1749 /DNA_ORIENTATION=+